MSLPKLEPVQQQSLPGICRCPHALKMLHGNSFYKTNKDYNDHKDTCKKCKLRQREQVFDGGSYFYVGAANDFLKSSTDPSKPKPAGICKLELDVVNKFPIQVDHHSNA
jgi:hypothetical protein